MLNSQFKIVLLSAVIVSFNQADQILFEDCSQQLRTLLQQCHEKVETLGIDCNLLQELEQQIAQTIPKETLQSQLSVQELTADIAQTTCKMPTLTEPIVPSIKNNITSMLNILTYATTRSARIIYTPEDPHIAEYQCIFTMVINITQQFINIPFITEYTEKKSIRCILADLIWQFGELRPASKKLIKNSQG